MGGEEGEGERELRGEGGERKEGGGEGLGFFVSEFVVDVLVVLRRCCCRSCRCYLNAWYAKYISYVSLLAQYAYVLYLRNVSRCVSVFVCFICRRGWLRWLLERIWFS